MSKRKHKIVHTPGAKPKPLDKKAQRAELITAMLRAESYSHDGFVPVPFLGTTWVRRGARYWWRRAGAALVVLLGSALVGVFAVGFTMAIIGGHGNPIRIVLGVVYDLTVVFGIRIGLRKVAEAPYDDKSLGVAYPGSGCVVFFIAPFTFGVVFTIFLAMLGPNFLGEKRARGLSRPAA